MAQIYLVTKNEINVTNYVLFFIKEAVKQIMNLFQKIFYFATGILLMISLPVNGFCSGYTYINISNPSLRKIPIAVPDFKNLSDNSQEIRYGKDALDILIHDLDFTGYLKTMDKGSFLQEPSKTGISQAEINFKDWTSIGSELLVTGGILVENNIVTLKLRLFDPFKGILLVGKVYTGHIADIRKMVHRFSGEISYKLTGRKGIFASKIAFVSKFHNYKEIFVCDFDGYNPVQVTHLKSITLSPSWSSDGKYLAYTSFVRGKPDIYIENLKEKRGIAVAFKGINITPDWVPGKFAFAACLSFSKDQEIYLLTGKGKIIKRLTNNWGIDVSPSFSPDGKKMAFVSRRGGTPQIYIKDLSTGNVTRLTFQGDYNTSPAWSPSGDKIAYVGSVKGVINIYSIGIDGSELVQLTSDTGDNEDPAWSPDGSLIVFSSTREGVARIYVMTAAGNDQRRLLKLKGAQTEPDWSLDSYF